MQTRGNPGKLAFWLQRAGLGLCVAASLGLVASAPAQGLHVGAELDAGTDGQPMLLMHSHAQGYLGVDVGDVDQERATALHLKEPRGAEITVLDHDAPAGKDGLKLHDVILQMDGLNVDGAEQVKRTLRESAPGRKLQLLVSRDGVQQAITVQLADRRKVEESARETMSTGSVAGPANGFLAGGDTPQGSGFPFWGLGRSLNVGALVEPLTPQMAEFFGLQNGLVIKSVARKSAAEAAGLKPHDVILQVGAEPVISSSDWERILRSNEGQPVQVTILRDRVKQLVLLQVDGKRHKASLEGHGVFPASGSPETE